MIALLPALAVGVSAIGAQAQTDDVQTGHALFDAHCASCHGLGAIGSELAPPLSGAGSAGVDFMVSTGRMPIDDVTQQPERRAPQFTKAEIAAIVAYVHSLDLGGPDVPSVEPASGNLHRGFDVFKENCMACHGAGLAGGALGGGAQAPPLKLPTALQIAEAVRFGPGMMPRFGPDILPQADLDSVVNYIEWLRVGRDRGGSALGHLGPVAEGFIAWVVGMGILLVVLRLGGKRT